MPSIKTAHLVFQRAFFAAAREREEREGGEREREERGEGGR